MRRSLVAESWGDLSTEPAGQRRFAYHMLFAGFALLVMVPFLSERVTEWDEVYVEAGHRLMAGEDLYPEGTNYSYPPFMAMVAFALDSLGATTGRIAWFAINLFAAFYLFRWGWNLTGGQNEPRTIREDMMFVAGLFCGLRYLLNGFSHLQTDLIIVTLMLGGCVGLQSRRPIWSGLAFGLAAGIKGPALLWAGYLLYRRKFTALVVMIVMTLGMNLLPDVVASAPTGEWWMQRWIAQKAMAVAHEEHYPGIWASTFENNQSLAGLVGRWTVGEWEWKRGGYVTGVRPNAGISARSLRHVLHGIEAVLLAVTAWCFWRGRQRRADGLGRLPADTLLAAEASVILLMIVLLSPMSSKPHFASLVVPGWFLARRAWESHDRRSAGFLLVSLLGLNAGWNVWGDHVEFFALWIGAMTLGSLALWGGIVLYLGSSHEDRVAPAEPAHLSDRLQAA